MAARPGSSALSGVPDGRCWHRRPARRFALWNEAGQLLREYASHPSTVADMQWKPGSQDLAVRRLRSNAPLEPRSGGADTLVEMERFAAGPRLESRRQVYRHGRSGCDRAFLDHEERRRPDDVRLSDQGRELSWDHTSRFLATGGGDPPCVWDVSGKGPAGTKPRQLQAHQAKVTALAFQHAGPMLASGGADGQVALWQPAKNQRLLTAAAHANSDHAIGLVARRQTARRGNRCGNRCRSDSL